MEERTTTTCDLCAGTAVVVPGEPRVCDPEKHAVGKHPEGPRPTARQVSYLLAHWYWTMRDSHAGISQSAFPHPHMILLLLSLQCPDLMRWAREFKVNGANFDGVFGEGPEGQAAHKEMFPLMEALHSRPAFTETSEGWERGASEDEGLLPWAYRWRHGVMAAVGVAILCLILYYLGGRS